MKTAFEILEDAAFDAVAQKSRKPLQHAIDRRSIDELKRAADIAWYHITNESRTHAHKVYEYLYGVIIEELDGVGAL